MSFTRSYFHTFCVTFFEGVNDNQIVEANLTTGRRVKLEPGITLHFSYQVQQICELRYVTCLGLLRVESRSASMQTCLSLLRVESRFKLFSFVFSHRSSSSVTQVNWQQSSTPFNKRFEKYLDPTFFQHRVRIWSNKSAVCDAARRIYGHVCLGDSL